eukprot:CAMPEP_0184042910 /NCGR_PEP_ID=MMETSP0955-20130417/66625_1 /TAXON_ID=627963 /ORGANISM="Aplanochytrium sp, Strain PBS07" /LENGTH=811 /DNA_ID=CAMNT_0026333755 /DNA_START=198 /DNA_END=2630 /DNA_ORIENTATION=+
MENQMQLQGGEEEGANSAEKNEKVKPKPKIDYSCLSENEKNLENMLRKVQSRSMKGEGDDEAKAIYVQVVNMRKQYLKQKRRNKKVENINKLNIRLSSMISLLDKELKRHRNNATTTKGGREAKEKQKFSKTEKRSRPKEKSSVGSKLKVVPSSNGSKVVAGLSSDLNETLFLDEEEVSLNDIELEELSDAKSAPEPAQQESEISNQLNKKIKKRRARKPKPKKWWHMLTDDDPITMEPLSSLKYPPFELVISSENSNRPNVVHHFDGKVLAHYIVSTGNFTNPNNRQELTREECRKLDEYLAINRLPVAKVTDAFDLSKAVRVQSSDQGRANMLQREATVVMQSLFSYEGTNTTTERNPQPEVFGSQRITNRVIGQQGGMTIVDGNQWDIVTESTLDSREEFPEMPVSRSSQQGTLYPSRWGQNRQTRGSEAFPALGSSSSREPSIGVPSSNTPNNGPWGAANANPGGWNRDSTRAVAVSLAAASGDAFKERPNARNTNQNLVSRPESRKLGLSTAEREPMFNPCYLCPYTPDLLEAIRAVGLQWILQVEKQLRYFVRSGPSVGIMHPRLPVMSRKKRILVSLLCRNFYGLDTVTMDQEPNCWLQVSKIPSSGVVEVSLADAVSEWGSSWLNSTYVKSHTAYTFSKDEMYPCIIMFGLQSNRKLTSNHLYDALSDLSRRSEFAVRWLGVDSVLLEFGDRVIARKVYTKLKVVAALKSFVKFSTIQWWPCVPDWATVQAKVRMSSNMEELRVSREQRQRLKVAQRLEDERKRMGSQKWQLKSGWDSDNEDDHVLLRAPSTEGSLKGSVNKW